MPVSLPVTPRSRLITFAAATVPGTVGTGPGIMPVPLPRRVDPVLVPVPQLLMALVFNATVFSQKQHQMDRSGFLRAIRAAPPVPSPAAGDLATAGGGLMIALIYPNEAVPPSAPLSAPSS